MKLFVLVVLKLYFGEATIMNIVTKKEKRNQGFAKILLDELLKLSQKEHCFTITLEVNENNLPAIHLYKKFHFEEVGKRKNYYKNGDTAILMTRKLNI